MTVPHDYFEGLEALFPEQKEKSEVTLVDKFAEERLEWGNKITKMTNQMKSLGAVSELMTEIYTERQICVEYYHYLIGVLIKINKAYRLQYSNRHDFWTFTSQIRYPNENSKNNKILTELADIHEKRELVENHSKFIQNTLATLDNLIYAIPRRIEIENIARGK